MESLMFDENVNIDKIIENSDLKPYFLDVVGKVFVKNLYASQSKRFVPKVKAQKEFYDSLYNLTEKLKYHVLDEQISSTITEVLHRYMEMQKPDFRKGKFDVF